jgi:plasmid rolling circle replication initiator protein Rep
MKNPPFRDIIGLLDSKIGGWRRVLNYDKENQDEVQEGFSDKRKSGKERPWIQKKVRSLVIADSFDRLDEPERAHRIRNCGTFLEFTRDIESGHRFLSKANFCRERLCPMCQWRRSLKVFWEVSHVMDTVESAYKNLRPLFLTLTVKNCQAQKLSETLDNIFKSWNVFLNHSKIKYLLVGWFRVLEVLYNKKTDEFHPHIHAVVFVDKDYFSTKNYMETAEWARLWKISLGVDYMPICDIRSVDNSKDKRKSIAEVAKYTVKDKQIATGNKVLTDHLVGILSKALKGRRLYAYGGILKKIVAAQGKEDLVHVSNDSIRGDVAIVIERYRWNFGLGMYKRVSVKDRVNVDKLVVLALKES